ncbi:hypothetical protein [Streptomyces sp. NPDC055107]
MITRILEGERVRPVVAGAPSPGGSGRSRRDRADQAEVAATGRITQAR